MTFLGSQTSDNDLKVGSIYVSGTTEVPDFIVPGDTCTVSTSTLFSGIKSYDLFTLNCSNLIPNRTGIFSTGFRISFPTLTVPPTLHVHQGGDALALAGADGFLAIPDQSLGTEYYVVTYCRMGGTCQFAVTPTNDSTTMTIYFPDNVTTDALCITGPGFSEIVAGTPLDFVLHELEVLHVESSLDLTGTRIIANKKAAVFIGARDVPTKDPYQTWQLVEQIPPVNKWGKEFVASPNRLNDDGNIIKIVTKVDNTKITVTGFSPFVIPTKAGMIERRIDWGMPVLITASNPVLVVQIMSTNMYTETHPITYDVMPAIVLIPSTDQWSAGTKYFPCNMLTMSTSFVDMSMTLAEGIGSSLNANYTVVGNTDYKVANILGNEFVNNNAAIVTVTNSRTAAYGYCEGKSGFLLDVDWSQESEVTLHV